MVEIAIEATSSGAGALAALVEAAANVEVTAWPAIVEDFHAIEARRFAAEGPGWAPWTQATQSIRSSLHATGTTIMDNTGTLRRALTTSDAPGSKVEMLPDELFVGTDLPYAHVHQQGGEVEVFGRGHATLPARPIVDVDMADHARWAEYVQAALVP